MGEVCLQGRCVTEGFEACDDGNTIDTDACTAACFDSYCGDGIHRTDLRYWHDGYETCDDSNDNNHDSCLNTCIAAALNDGVHRQDVAAGNMNACSNADDHLCDLGEQCRFYPDPCPEEATCEGICLDPNYEGCDDGDQDDADGCSRNGLPLGSLALLAGQSCQAIANDVPSAEDGVFWIDPDGRIERDEEGEITSGSNAPYRVYCDFEVSDGERHGWTLFVGGQTPQAHCGECESSFEGSQTPVRCGPWELGSRGTIAVYSGECGLGMVSGSGNYLRGFTARIHLSPGFLMTAVRYSGDFRSNRVTQLPGTTELQCNEDGSPNGVGNPTSLQDIEHRYIIPQTEIVWSNKSAGDLLRGGPCWRSLTTLREVWVR